MKSYHDDSFFYPVPTYKNGKWIPTKWITEKDSESSDNACGKGLHVMKILNPKYGRYTGNCYEAEGKNLLGEDEYKARFESIRLIRPVFRDEIFIPKANLSAANLYSADLYSADLRSADLRYADLSYANLYSANLRYADLRSARNIDETLNLDKAYWNKFTCIDEEFKHLLNKERFLD